MLQEILAMITKSKEIGEQFTHMVLRKLLRDPGAHFAVS